MNVEHDQDAEEAGNIRLALAAVAMHALIPLYMRIDPTFIGEIGSHSVAYADGILAALAAPR
jgi:hypothetical protein